MGNCHVTTPSKLQRENADVAQGPPPMIFEQQSLPQQTVHRWKGNLMASKIHFKY